MEERGEGMTRNRILPLELIDAAIYFNLTERNRIGDLYA